MAENRKPKFFYGYVVVLASFLTSIIAFGTTYSFGVFFKLMLTEFGWTRALTSSAFSLHMVLKGLLAIGTGRLNDRLGPRIVMMACGFFLGLGFLLMSQISNIWQLYLFYGVIVAIGMSGSLIPLASTVARWFVKRRGMMTGIVVSGIGFGTVIVPPVANWLIANYGWRTSYIIIGSIALVLIISAAQFLRRDPAQMGQLPYGENEVKPESLNLEARGLSLREATHTRQLWMLFFTLLCFSISLFTILVHIVPHATDLGISATNAANILAIIGGVGIPSRLIMGSVADRIGNKPAITISFVILLVASLWLLAATELWMLYLFAAILGFGYGGWSALESPLVASLFGLTSHGVIMAVIVLGVSIGGAIGPALAGHIFDITGSYQLAFLVSVVVSIIGLILIALLRPTTGEEALDSIKASV